jgi:hypothetical protein
MPFAQQDDHFCRFGVGQELLKVEKASHSFCLTIITKVKIRKA